jgi:nucleoside-diphosphate-sugar epimerase
MSIKKIVLTSANSFTAGLLLPKLSALGYHTTALIRKQGHIEADVTINDWMNSAKAKKALLEADCIIHLSGEINSKQERTYVQANVETTQIVTEAAGFGKPKRIIFLSYPGAAPDHRNLYLKYKGQAEQLLLTTKNAIIFRCPIIIDSPDIPSRVDTLFISNNNKPVQVIGNGNQKMHPVYRGDVVDTILSAIENGEAGIYELSGIDQMTTDEFIQLVNQNPKVKIAHTPGWLAFLLSRVIKTLSPTFVDILLHHTDCMYDPKTYLQFKTKPTSLIALWSKQRHYYTAGKKV